MRRRTAHRGGALIQRARPDVLVVTGERSGDRLARGLVGELLRRARLRVVAATGEAIPGATHLPVPRPLGAMGLLDGLRAARGARRAHRALLRWARAARPRLLVTVDAPSFTLRLSRALRPLPAVHVVAPQVWAWRPGRARRLGEATDAVLCLLPFEPPWFAGHLRAVYVGHPAAGIRPAPRGPRPAVALLPGSRVGEVRRLGPVMRQVAARLRSRRPELALLTIPAPGVPPLGVPGVVHLPRIEALAGVEGAVAASGTVTLQLMALGVPQVVVAATDPVSWWVGSRVVRTPWVALPNILAGAPVVAEHVQRLDPEAIVRDLLRARPLPPQDLGGPGAFARMADEVQARLAVGG